MRKHDTGSIGGKLIKVGWNQEVVVFEDDSNIGFLRVIYVRQCVLSIPLSPEEARSSLGEFKLMSPQEFWESLR